jgi:hypothetical protein
MDTSILLLTITLILVGFLGYYVTKYSFGKHPPKKFVYILGFVLIIVFSSYSYAFLTRPQESPLRPYDVPNVVGLFFAFFFLQSLRIILDQLDVKARVGRFNFNKTALYKNSGDMIIECTVFGAIYTTIAYTAADCSSHKLYTLIGLLLSTLPIFKVLKYRIYDDLYKRWLHRGGSFIGDPTSPPSTLLQGIYNVLFRAYFAIALSFASIYTLLYYYNLHTSETRYITFSINNASGNMFVDFIYFSIITMSTVGYGDISPVGVVPKLLCAFQVLLGYFFIGSTFAYIFYVIGTQSEGSKHEKKRMR